MRRKPTKLPSSTSESDEDGPPIQKPSKIPKPADDSSSESDIENYLQPINQIDLNSSFFDIQKNIPFPTSQVEDDVFESDEDTGTIETASTSKSHFQQLHDYTKKMEEAKKSVDDYKIRKRTEEKQTDVLNLLATAETKLFADESILTELDINLHSSDFESCSDSEKEAWEEVGEAQNIIPKENLEITVEMPGVIKKKKREDIVAVIKRRINRIRKLNQLLIHKVHLLCWIAHGNYVNAAINSDNILAAALSLVPPEPARPTDLKYIEHVVKWYKNVVSMGNKYKPKNKSLEELLEAQIAKKQAYDRVMFVYIFVAVLRSLRVPCRLVLSLQVEPVRPPKSDLISLSTKNNNEVNKSRTSKFDSSKIKIDKNKENKSKQLSKNSATKTKKKENSAKTQTEGKESTDGKIEEKRVTRSKSAAETKNTEEKVAATRKTRTRNATEPKATELAEVKNEQTMKTRSHSATAAKKNETDAKENIEKTKLSRLKRNKQSPKLETAEKKSQSQTSSTLITAYLKKTKSARIATGDSKKSPVGVAKSNSKVTQRLRSHTSKIPQLDGPNDDSSDDDVVTASKPKLRTLPRRLVKKFGEYKASDSEDDSTVRSPFSPRNRSAQTSNLTKTNRIDGKINDLIEREKEILRKRRSNEDSDNDSDYIPETKKKLLQTNDLGPLEKVKKPAKKSKIEEEKHIQGEDFWVEIFSDTEKRWISVDVIEGQVDCVNELYSRATHPVSYILAWNNINTIKDVSSRYCKSFNTTTRGLRIDPKWWTATLKPFTGPKTVRDQREDDELERRQLETPLPKTIKEYKNHPLYVLKRHLLKYEAIYPPDTPTLGFVRKEPVYPRQSVYILHPRDIWLKKAKVVKPREVAYKIVKGRPRWDKLAHKIVTDAEMDIFGPWQVDDYEPPTAENGVVPRNAYGNVELFKPCMLPKKTVHLRLAGLNKVARRMNIDCASAFTGFDYSRGWVHPAYDGYVVCEEYADILVAAWELEQDELEQKEQEKIDKRVYGNWKKLIKGLLIRERLKAKYDFGDVSRGGEGKKAKKGPRFSIKKRK